MTGKHRSYPARQQHADRDDLRAVLLGRFANEEKFRRHLAVLARHVSPLRRDLAPLLPGSWYDLFDEAEWEDAPPVVARYVAMVHAFAAQNGLDCFHDEWGAFAVHDWLTRRLADPHYPPADFGLGLYPVRIAPELPPGIPERDEEGRGRRVVPVSDLTSKGRALRVSVTIDDHWYWRRESPADAKKRLSAQAKRLINAYIDALAGQMEQAGDAFGEDAPALAEHLDWLFARMFHRQSCFDIAFDVSEQRGLDVDAGEGLTESAVRKPTDRLATRIGLILPRLTADTKRA